MIIDDTELDAKLKSLKPESFPFAKRIGGDKFVYLQPVAFGFKMVYASLNDIFSVDKFS